MPLDFGQGTIRTLRVLGRERGPQQVNSHSTEAILLPFHTILGSHVIGALFFLAKVLLLRSQELKQPGDVKHALKYLRYLQDQSIEASNVTRNEIKASLVWALADQVELESVYPTRDFGEMATLCRELLRSGAEESLLIDAVGAFADAIDGTIVPFGQPPPDGAIECLREARTRLPNLEGVRFTLASCLFVRSNRAHSDEDYEKAVSIVDEMTADPNEDVEQATELVSEVVRKKIIPNLSTSRIWLRLLKWSNPTLSGLLGRFLTGEIQGLILIHFVSYSKSLIARTSKRASSTADSALKPLTHFFP